MRLFSHDILSPDTLFRACHLGVSILQDSISRFKLRLRCQRSCVYHQVQILQNKVCKCQLADLANPTHVCTAEVALRFTNKDSTRLSQTADLLKCFEPSPNHCCINSIEVSMTENMERSDACPTARTPRPFASPSQPHLHGQKL
jgi:hypothetical protein